MPLIPFYHQAIQELAPDLTFKIQGEDYSTLISRNSEDLPSKSAIEAEVIRMQGEYDAQEYARKRASEYPSITDVVIALAEKEEGRSAMWDTITAQRLDVKSKYPKP